MEGLKFIASKCSFDNLFIKVIKIIVTMHNCNFLKMNCKESKEQSYAKVKDIR